MADDRVWVAVRGEIDAHGSGTQVGVDDERAL
jgi:hypothetical protein